MRACAAWISRERNGRPMSRLAEYTVLRGAMIRRCLPSTPTMTEPLGWNDTTDGWIFTPLASASTLGAPVASQAATTELVVPRSMPTMGSATASP